MAACSGIVDTRQTIGRCIEATVFGRSESGLGRAGWGPRWHPTWWPRTWAFMGEVEEKGRGGEEEGVGGGVGRGERRTGCEGSEGNPMRRRSFVKKGGMSWQAAEDASLQVLRA